MLYHYIIGPMVVISSSLQWTDLPTERCLIHVQQKPVITEATLQSTQKCTTSKRRSIQSLFSPRGKRTFKLVTFSVCFVNYQFFKFIGRKTVVE